MMEFKTKIEELKFNELKILRAEKRNRKIIIVLESDLYSDEVFAVNPYYDEGEKNNKLQDLNINLKISENKGMVKAEASFGGVHYTTGHSQLHNAKVFFKDKKDLAIYEILNLDETNIFDNERMNKLLKMWENEKEFQEHIKDIIEKRKNEIKKEKIKETLENIKNENLKLEKLMNL